MKKLKIIVSILVLALVVAYFVCSLAIPIKTAEATDKVLAWLSTPIGIAGISTTIGGLRFK